MTAATVLQAIEYTSCAGVATVWISLDNRELTMRQARTEIADRAGIEFDPAVVKTFLALELRPELDSFAKEEQSPAPHVENDTRWEMFSSLPR